MTLPFEHDEWITIAKLNGEEFTDCHFNIYGKDKTTNGEKVLLYTSNSRPLRGGSEFNLEHKITIDYLFYNETAKLIAGSSDLLPTQIEFFWELVANSEDQDGAVTTETEELEDTLTVHFVRYIPKLMNILGFVNGEKLMRKWFASGMNQDIHKVDPELDFIDWNWLVCESKEVKEEYDEFKDEVVDELDSYFTNEGSRSLLRAEIKKMIDEGLITLPTEANPKVDFGVSSSELTTDANSLYPDGEIMPMFEKYYFISKSFGSGGLLQERRLTDLGKHYIREYLKMDDFMAAIATFSYRVYASGYLEYKKGGYFTSDHTLVHVTQLSFYLKDRYDFADEDPNDSQDLGYWKIEEKSAIKVFPYVLYMLPLVGKHYYKVENKEFNNYRNDHGEGYDYHLYSTVNHENMSISPFKL